MEADQIGLDLPHAPTASPHISESVETPDTVNLTTAAKITKDKVAEEAILS